MSSSVVCRRFIRDGEVQRGDAVQGCAGRVGSAIEQLLACAGSAELCGEGEGLGQDVGRVVMQRWTGRPADVREAGPLAHRLRAQSSVGVEPCRQALDVVGRSGDVERVGTESWMVLRLSAYRPTVRGLVTYLRAFDAVT